MASNALKLLTRSVLSSSVNGRVMHKKLPLTCTQFTRNCSHSEDDRKVDKPLKQLMNQDRVIAPEDLSSSVDEDSWSAVSSMKYETFADSKTRIIYDMNEEDLSFIEPSRPAKLSFQEIYKDLSYERGKRGVFDVEDLMEVLKMQNAVDPIAIEMPAKYRLWEHMVVASASSQRHSSALAMAVRMVYNRRAAKTDRALILEGRDSPWVAMDIGNIALHIMSPKERKRIDLETLWINGPENDPKSLEEAVEQQDDVFELAEELPENYEEDMPYDITKEYIHRYIPVGEDVTLPDISQVTEENRQSFAATSNVEMALRRHNGKFATKFRGRFMK